jgi:hypothetical protein
VLQHLCLCFSNCVPASAIVFQLLCSNTCACSITNRLSSMTTLTICVSFCVPALFSHLCCSICVRICVAASVFAFVLQQHLCSHLCCSVCVRICVAACFSICVRICVAASLCVPASCVFLLHLFLIYKQSIAINDNLDHLRHLCL